MNQDYGLPAQGESAHTPHRPPARYLVVIDAGGSATVHLFNADRTQAASFDGGVEEVAQMTRGLAPMHGAAGAEWDRALSGHSAAERAAARVYTLDL